jgi:MFS superfamily sulfate permease-like transporter
LALVGILESLLTAKLLDELTDTDSDKNKEIRGQGLANVVSGLFGGMAGCAMIGQSMINVKSGAGEPRRVIRAYRPLMPGSQAKLNAGRGSSLLCM